MSGRTEYGRCEDRALAGSPRSSPGRPDGILSAPCALACDIVTVEVRGGRLGFPWVSRLGDWRYSDILDSLSYLPAGLIPWYLFHTMGTGKVSAWFGEYHRVRILPKAICAASRADPAP